jgi:hypothetical protein
VDLWLERGRSSVEDDGTVRPEVEEVRPRTSSNLFVRKKYDLVELNFECSVLGVRVCFVVLMFPFNPPELYGFRVQIYTYQINGSILFFSPSSGKNWGSKNVRRSKTISSVLSWSIFLDAPFNILVSFN